MNGQEIQKTTDLVTKLCSKISNLEMWGSPLLPLNVYPFYNVKMRFFPCRAISALHFFSSWISLSFPSQYKFSSSQNQHPEVYFFFFYSCWKEGMEICTWICMFLCARMSCFECANVGEIVLVLSLPYKLYKDKCKNARIHVHNATCILFMRKWNLQDWFQLELSISVWQDMNAGQCAGFLTEPVTFPSIYFFRRITGIREPSSIQYAIFSSCQRNTFHTLQLERK